MAVTPHGAPDGHSPEGNARHWHRRRRRFTARSKSAFSRHNLPDNLIAVAVHWSLRCRLGLVDVVEWLAERGVHVARSTVSRWLQRLMLFGVVLFFRLQCPPLAGWPTVTCQVALTYTACTAVIIVALAATDAGRPDLIRSPARVLAHTGEGYPTS